MNDLNTNWYNNQLIVGAFPTIENADEFSDYDVIINMSDKWYIDVHLELSRFQNMLFWFPMNENMADIGLNSIYGAIIILRHCEDRNLRVYLHCNAGINRSVMTKQAYYYMRTGEFCADEINKLQRNIYLGYFGHNVDVLGFIRSMNNLRCKNGLLGNLKFQNQKT